MNEELEQDLVDNHGIFDLYNEEPDNSNQPVQLNLFGFQCGDGWYDIIDSLAEYIERQPVDMQVVQVKEKFGMLRFYYTITNSEDEGYSHMINGAVQFAKEISAHVCEECGDNGEHRKDGGWFRTRCDSCFDNQ